MLQNMAMLQWYRTLKVSRRSLISPSTKAMNRKERLRFVKRVLATRKTSPLQVCHIAVEMMLKSYKQLAVLFSRILSNLIYLAMYNMNPIASEPRVAFKKYCPLYIAYGFILQPVTQQNSYSISHLPDTVTTQRLPLWRCSHCSLVPDTVTTKQWLHRTHTILGIYYHWAYVEICLLGTKY